MAGKISKAAIEQMRAVVGPDPSEMELIRYLHLAKSRVPQAINFYFDSLFTSGGGQTPASSHTPAPNALKCTTASNPSAPATPAPNPPPQQPINTLAPVLASLERLPQSTTILRPSTSEHINHATGTHQPQLQAPSHPEAARAEIAGLDETGIRLKWKNALLGSGKASSSDGGGWFLLGESHVQGFATCKGSGKVQAGEELGLSFPKSNNGLQQQGDKRRGVFGKFAKSGGSSDIVRFSSARAGEIGRLPGDWAKALVPLVAAGEVRVEARCLFAPATLAILADVGLTLRVFASSSLFRKATEPISSAAAALSESSTGSPLSTLLKLLSLQPIQKAEFTPEDFLSRKRALVLGGNHETDAENAGRLSPNAAKRPCLGFVPASSVVVPPDNAAEPEAEVTLSDSEVTKYVGSTDNSELPEMEPPSNMLCDLRPYQKQALGWMTNRETGETSADAAKTLHPCWEAYHLADEKRTPFYHNVFSGEVTFKFPSALQTARGGILADAMGLGKTVMAISLIVANPGRGGSSDESQKAGTLSGSSDNGLQEEAQVGGSEQGDPALQSFSHAGTGRPLLGRRKGKRGAGTLIVCPMTLLSQWKAECETHTKVGSLSVCLYYGSDRARERGSLIQHDVVITTYGVLSSEINNENFMEDGPIHCLHWHRVILDEAHTIKAMSSQQAKAVFHLTADRRWSLTGTPIQNQLADIFSLLHFLRVEPWCNWGWWNKLIQKPYEDGDERSLKLLQGILRPLMLRRTKDTLDKEGRPILVLPPSNMQVIEVALTDAERDFYDALHKKSKVKFDKFVEEGRILHNYASILELLLRLRQCCDHPFLVLSRGDTSDFSDLDKLARKFLTGGGGTGAGPEDASKGPTRAYVREMVEELKKGEKSECPICLEFSDDAVITPCAHIMCRECLLASWRTSGQGSCPICRQPVTRQDLITAPSDSRFQLDVEANWTESAKVDALLSHLEPLRKSGEKSIVFSQWTSFLDLLEIPFRRRNFQYVRLDGTMSQQQREKTIRDFSTRPDISVMLISLKAGGVGINLTAASNAFLLDPWWNPAVEEQAIMRIHRIGQKKPVNVVRFIVKNTVEEKMQLVQSRKQRMVNGALTDSEVRSARIEELKMLFR